MKYIAALLALALAVTFTSALPYPAEAPGYSWGPYESKGDGLVEKRHGGHDGHGPSGWGPPGPPGPPDWGHSDWGHSQPQNHDQHQDQQQQQQQQQEDDKPYSYNTGLPPDEEEAEDNITWSHAAGGSKE